jgi:ketosteroid isomerase-like protein
MSQENVEVVRGRIDAFNRGDRSAWLASLDEDYEIAPLDDWPDARAIRGGEAGWDFYRDVAEILSFERVHVEFVDAGVERSWATSDMRRTAEKAVPTSRLTVGSSPRCGKEKFSATSGSRIVPTPSKPPGSRSRRCRG